MTRVSSESSSPSSCVMPSARADNSSTRLEMLLDPGNFSSPDAARTGCKHKLGLKVMTNRSCYPKSGAPAPHVLENPEACRRRRLPAPVRLAAKRPLPHAARPVRPADCSGKYRARLRPNLQLYV